MLALSDEEAAVAAVAAYSTPQEACLALRTAPSHLDLVRLRRANWAQVASALREHRVEGLYVSVDPSLAKVHLCLDSGPAEGALHLTATRVAQLAV